MADLSVGKGAHSEGAHCRHNMKTVHEASWIVDTVDTERDWLHHAEQYSWELIITALLHGTFFQLYHHDL